MPDCSAVSLTYEIVEREISRRAKLKQTKADCEVDLLSFVRAFWHILEPETPLVEGWTLAALCDILMAVTDGHLTRLIINVPPGFMKSLMLNVFWPAWEWGPQDMAHLRYLSASYSASLTERDNGRLARLITDETYQRLWGDRVKLTKDGVGKLETAKTGWKLATSVGGTTTGERGDRVLIDDANNPASVESEAVRSTTNQWLTEVMPDRLNNIATGVIICLQQRTHEQDATGTLAERGTGYVWWCVPMEFDPLRNNPVHIRWDDNGQPIETIEDPRGLDAAGMPLEGLFEDERGEFKLRMGSPLAKVEGALAWPERFPADEIEGLRTIKGPYAWAGQYQQSPTVRGGGIIRRDWWQIWTQPDFPDLGTVVAGLDTAIKESEENDYNAFQTWGAFPGPGGEPKLIMTSAWKLRCSLGELVARVADSCYRQKVDYLVIEDKARGHDVAAEILRQFSDVPWQTIMIPVNGSRRVLGRQSGAVDGCGPVVQRRSAVAACGF